MSGDEDRREKRRRWWEDDLFQSQFEAVKRMINELMERLGGSTPEDLRDPDIEEHLEELMRDLQKSPMVWGFSAAIGPDGRIRLNPFGNLSTEGSTPEVREEREPLVEVMEQDDTIIVVAELPGVEEKDIQLTFTNTQVIIHVDTPHRKYHKTLELPTPIQHRAAQVHYTNGILELHIPKK